MTEQEFEALLQRSESDTIDFKSQNYDFDGSDDRECKRKRAKFAKDIICMANTPRKESAYIVLGIQCNPSGNIEVGLIHQIDGSILQQKIEKIVYPHPQFRYITIPYKGKHFAVIEIPANQSIGPFYSTEDAPGEELLRKNILYFRRDSKNSEADAEEKKYIYAWFNGDKTTQLLPYGDDSAWDRFVAVADITAPSCRYILLLSTGHNSNTEPFEHLAWVDWGFVIDFDRDSDISGVLNRCRKELEARRAVHLLTLGDQISGNISRSTTWYFARGMTGRVSTPITSKYAEWLKTYGNDLRRQLSTFSASSSLPVVLVAMWNEPQLTSHLRKCLETATEVFTDTLTTVLLTENSEPYEALTGETETQVIRMANKSFLEGLSVLQKSREIGKDKMVLFPGRDGIEKEVLYTDIPWLEEDLELVHLSCGNQPDTTQELSKAFLQGAPISWFDLGIHCDIPRDKAAKIDKRIRRDLEVRQPTRINLYHRPGAGGSTLARRLLWGIHRDYPAVILKRCEPRETIERIAKVYSLTEKSVLVLREGSIVSDAHADELADLLAARQVPSVLLQVLRRYAICQEHERTFYLDSQLSNPESERFRVVFIRECPDRQDAINSLHIGNTETRTPFIFGLTAFVEGFIGLKPYVANHIKELNDLQRRIVIFFSIAHSYGQKPISEQYFAQLLQLPANRMVQLRKALSPPALGLLIETSPGIWRTSHELVAREIIRQILASNLADERNWNTRLADLACNFADFCRSRLPVQPDDLNSIVERVFLYRDDAEILGTIRAGDNLFSQLINDIPERNGRLRVFQRLVNIFPGEAHLWAHLGRFYSVQLREYQKAIDAIEHSLSLRSDDPTLHHMKGMAIRNLCYQKMEQKLSLEDLLPLAKQASSCFEQVRTYNPDDEYGHISEVQMIIKLLDYCQSGNPGSAVQVASSHKDPWLNEAFQRVEELLLRVRQTKKERPSEYEERCRADLDTLYGAHEKALQRWQNLLDRRDNRGRSQVYAPPIRRQIVWTLLARNQRSWNKLPTKELKRCVDLLETNIQEEPGDDSNIRLWIQSARFLTPTPSLEVATERVAYWKSNGNSLDAAYYLYVLNVLQAITGSVLAGDMAVRALDECRQRVRYRRYRTRSFEWLGHGKDLQMLLHQDQLGDWDGFWQDTSPLRRLEGVVTSIKGPQAGEIEISGGLRAFFIPSFAGMGVGRGMNVRVSFFLGFSYDGPRAWVVEPIT